MKTLIVFALFVASLAESYKLISVRAQDGVTLAAQEWGNPATKVQR